jgi:DNA-binding LytR/AlgR family response regulator
MNTILQKEGLNEEELNERINDLMSYLEGLGFLVEAFQTGVLNREKPTDYLYFKNGSDDVKIRYASIIMITSADNYVQVHTEETIKSKETKPEMYLTTLTAIEDASVDSPLARPNRTTIVNTNYISKINRKVVYIKDHEVEITPVYGDKFLKKAGCEISV